MCVYLCLCLWGSDPPLLGRGSSRARPGPGLHLASSRSSGSTCCPLPDGDSPAASCDSGMGGPRARADIWARYPGPGGGASAAPPGSGRQAPGQLVAISSVDYLVAMPSGVRARSPAPRDAPLAGAQSSLGPKPVTVSATLVGVGVCPCVRVRVGGFCGSRPCARACMHWRAQASLLRL